MTDYRDLACDPTVTLDVVARLQEELPVNGFMSLEGMDPDLEWLLGQLGEIDEDTDEVTCEECGGAGRIRVTYEGADAVHVGYVLRQLRDAVELADLIGLRPADEAVQT